MSTITKISPNREETDNYASEERKIEMRRRMQLQARGKASLSLSSLEELAKGHSPGISLKDMRFGKSGSLAELDDHTAGNREAREEAVELVNSSLLKKIPKLPSGKDESSNFDNDGKNRNSVPDGSEEEKKSNAEKSIAVNASTHREEIQTASKLASERSMQHANKNLESQEAEAIHSSLLHGLNNNLEEMLARAQAVADDNSGFSENRRQTASATISSSSLIPGLTEADSARVIGKMRFLKAFVDGLPAEHPRRDELLANIVDFFNEEKKSDKFGMPSILDEEGIFEEKQLNQAMGDDEISKNRQAESIKKSLDVIYSYLDSITAASTAPTLPNMMEKFSKVIKNNPEHAIQRLALSGAGLDTIELVAREAERRLIKLSEKIDMANKRNALSDSFKEAITDEREKLRLALLNFEKISNLQTSRQFAEKERERSRAENTLPSLIAKSV